MKFLRDLKKNIAAEETTQQQPNGSQEVVWRSFGYTWLIILLGILLISSLWLFVRQQVSADYDRTIEETSTETTNLTIAFEEHVRRIIADVNKDLLSQKHAYEKNGVSSPVIAEIMESTAEDSSRVQVAITNERGILVASFNKAALGIDVADRDYFQFQRDSSSDTLFIGKPIQTKLGGISIIPVSRRINNPDGSFAGVVYVTLNSNYFSSFYNKMNLGQDQRITLIGTDWIVRARQSGNNMEVGQNVYGAPLWKNVQNGHTSGTYISDDVLDGISRIVSYRVMPDYPLVVSVGKATQVALAGYERRKQGYVGGALLSTLFIMAFCGLLVNWMRHFIRKGEKQYESLLANMPDGFAYCKMIYDNDEPVDLIYLAVNDAFAKLTGLKDVIGKRITTVLPGIKKTNPELLQIYGRVAGTGRSERFEGYYESLSAWLSITVSSDQEGYFMAIFSNITKRKAMENELDKHREHLQILVGEQTLELEKAMHEIRRQNAMLAGINGILLEALVCNTEEELGRKCLTVLEEVTGSKFGFIGKINSAGKMDNVAISNPGWDACDIVDKTGHIRVATESEVRGLYGRVIDDGIGFFTNDPASHPDSIGLPEGHPRVNSFLGTPLIFEGRSFGVVVLGNRNGGYSDEDLHTAQTMSHAVVQAFMHKRSQQEIFLKNNEITAILGSITDAFYALDSEWRFTLINPVAAQSGIGDNQGLVGKNIWKVFPELMNSELYHKYHEAYTMKEPIHTIMKDPQSDRWLDMNIYPYLGGIFVYYKDFTDRMMYEKELARLDRLNTVGEIAASIGHEVRNPLTTVRGYLQHYGRKTAFAEYREPFALMIAELDRANAIITEFLSLAKNKAVHIRPTDLNMVIQSLVSLLQPDALLRGINIELKIGDIPEVLADDKEMRQCILNLVSNALDATPKGGTVIIGTAVDKNRVVMTVRDQGSGIPPEIKDKLGTPFLTTKEHGAGLGMAVCYRIAQRHQATIEVETGLEGTTIHFIFNLEEKLV